MQVRHVAVAMRVRERLVTVRVGVLIAEDEDRRRRGEGYGGERGAPRRSPYITAARATPQNGAVANTPWVRTAPSRCAAYT